MYKIKFIDWIANKILFTRNLTYILIKNTKNMPSNKIFKIYNNVNFFSVSCGY